MWAFFNYYYYLLGKNNFRCWKWDSWEEAGGDSSVAARMRSVNQNKNINSEQKLLLLRGVPLAEGAPERGDPNLCPKCPPICSPVPKGDPDACLLGTPPRACARLHGFLCVSMLSGLSFRNLVKKKNPIPEHSEPSGLRFGAAALAASTT